MNRTTAAHYWFGQWINDEQLQSFLQDGVLSAHINQTLSHAFPFASFLDACEALADDLTHQHASFNALSAYLSHNMPASEVTAVLAQLRDMLQKEYLNSKLLSELGTTVPNVLERRYPHRQYETWAPLGCLVHVMPSNVFAVAAMGLLEGLLSNNINVVKVSARDTDFTAMFAQELVRHDVSGRLQHHIAVLRLSSKQNDVLQALFNHADVISAWGGEAAIAAIRKMAPESVRIVAWGHKVSFAYLSQNMLTNQEAIAGFAHDMCVLDQQACSSPQTLFVEGNQADLLAVAESLIQALEQVAPNIPKQEPDQAAWAEISTVMNVARAEQTLGLCQVFESEQQDWRVIVDYRDGLKPSPLYRTLWIKPIERERITAVIRPMRAWLQTCGLAASFHETAAISRQLFAAGVTRITRAGEMLKSYTGSPHDGVYALQQFMRRITLDADASFAQVGSFAQLAEPESEAVSASVPIMQKTDFLNLMAEHQDAPYGLVVRSGGSSGQTAYSRFTWQDYAKQMHETAHGLLAAGIDPERDVVMNLFAAGYMYGSFISFWTILEALQVRQLPMAMVSDYDLIVDELIQQKATAVIGMTPHLLALFSEQAQRIKAYGGLKKFYYGGEGLSDSQRQFLLNECGLEVVRSVVYGSNDAGPIGYQCEHCQGGEHHLMSSLQQLEIVDLEQDKPAREGEVGRLILSSRARSTPKIQRYEIGDTGRWINRECACGRTDPLFELMGRLGDVFKAGTPQLNYAQFVKVLSEQCAYSGRLQIHLHNTGQKTLIDVWVDETLPCASEEAIETLFEHYHELSAIRGLNLPADLKVSVHDAAEFVVIKASGKIKHLCDHR